MPTPLDDDMMLTEHAERLGMEVERRQSVRVTDQKALEEQGLTRQVVDYNRVRKLLLDGREVQGAELGEYEYVLRRPHAH